MNENDTVSIEEILLWTTTSSALVAVITGADLLLLVDIDGIFNRNPHLHADAQLISEALDLESIRSYIEEKESTLGTGGMSSKVHALKSVRKRSEDVDREWTAGQLHHQGDERRDSLHAVQECGHEELTANRAATTTKRSTMKHGFIGFGNPCPYHLRRIEGSYEDDIRLFCTQ